MIDVGQKYLKRNINLTMIIISCLIVLTRSAISIEDTPIQTSRHASRIGICSFYEASYTQEEISKAKSAIGAYNYLSTKQIQSLIYDKNFMQIKTQMIIQTAPHIITLIIALILWIPLCCCCVWPEKHPVCKKCRKNEKQVYHRCQLKWTSYLTIIFYVVVMVGSILGVMSGINIVKHFNNVGCKFVTFGDDLLHGRISSTVQNRFFSGLTPYSSNLNTFKTNFNVIWTQSSNSLSTASSVRTNQAGFEISVNSTYTNYNDISYVNAFMDSNGATNITVQSQFKDMHLGPTSDSTKILGSIYTTTDVIFKQINAVLDPMIAAWGRLSSTTQSVVRTQMTTTQTLITSLKGNINDYIDTIYKLFNNKQVYNQSILGLQLLFGIFLGLSILGLISTILIAFCSVVRTRLIIYFTCIGMYILSILCFFVLIMLSIVGPNLSQVCAYMETKFTTGNNTKEFFMKLGFNELGDMVQNCMADGTGWIINDLSPTFNSSFADLVLITKNTQIFNLAIPGYSTSNINAPITAGADKVTKIINAKILQINDTVALAYLDALRLNALPNTNCNNVNVAGDSWLPSYDTHSCPGGKAQNNLCLNLSQLSICPLGCYEIMNQLFSTSGDSSYGTNLALRYGGSNCTYYNYVKNLHENWNLQRKTKLDTVTSSITNIQNLATTYDNNFKTRQTSISGFKTILQTNYNSQTNLTVGAFNGMDCRVIGQSIIDLRNAICVGLLSSINQNFLIFLLISYGSLMVACCATCTGVRHFKHLQKMSIHTGYRGQPVSISSQRFFEKSA